MCILETSRFGVKYPIPFDAWTWRSHHKAVEFRFWDVSPKKHSKHPKHNKCDDKITSSVWHAIPLRQSFVVPNILRSQVAAASSTVSEANLRLPSHRSRAWGVGNAMRNLTVTWTQRTDKGIVIMFWVGFYGSVSFYLLFWVLYVVWHWWFDKPPIYGSVGDVFFFFKSCQRYETIPIGLILGNFLRQLSHGDMLYILCFFLPSFCWSGKIPWNIRGKRMKPESLRQHLFQLVSRPIWQQRPEQIRVDEASLRLQRQFQWLNMGDNRDNNLHWTRKYNFGISHQPGFWYSNVMMLLMLICGTYVAPHM